MVGKVPSGLMLSAEHFRWFKVLVFQGGARTRTRSDSNPRLVVSGPAQLSKWTSKHAATSLLFVLHDQHARQGLSSRTYVTGRLSFRSKLEINHTQA